MKSFQLIACFLFLYSFFIFYITTIHVKNLFFSVILFWLGLDLIALSVAYFINNPNVLGKNSSKRYIGLLFIPFLFLNYSLFYIRVKFSKENFYDKLFDTIYIGRNLFSNEISVKIDRFIDLTYEFNLLRKKSSKIINFQILDGSIPEKTNYINFIDSILDLKENLYIHCAFGHGRTGIVAASLILRKGIVNNIEEAINYVKVIRPKIKLNQTQIEFLTEIHK